MKTIDDVRTHLFKALDGLSDKSMEIDRAKAICETAQVIINSAKVEVDYMRFSGGKNTAAFLEGHDAVEPALPAGVTGMTHRLRG